MNQIPFDDCDYFPHLFLRPAEVNALEKLQESLKNFIYPVIFFRPWVNSKTIEKGVERLEKALGTRRYFIEPDRFYSNSKSPSASQFLSLRDPAKSFENLRIFSQQYERMNVTINGNHLSPQDVSVIENWSDQQNKRVIFTFWLRDGSPGSAIDSIAASDNPLSSISINTGWNSDILSLELRIFRMLEYLIASGISNEKVIILTGSSFPDRFDIEREYQNFGKMISPIKERQLYGSLRARFNNLNLVYGDWASTREPADSIMRSTVRLDYCNGNYWYSRRSFQTAQKDYNDLAQEAVNDPDFAKINDSWGKYLIENSVLQKTIGVNSTIKNTSSRINMHLAAQIGHSKASPTPTVDEEYPDD